jgi:DNA-binding FadR family transcriptional regulator
MQPMVLTAPARAATLSAQVARQFEQLITSGEWPVGKRIPPETELVARLGLSRNTVREALRSLVHLGMLEAKVGDGTYVRALSELEAPMVRRVHRARLDEALELRAMLEKASAGLAAQRRSPDEATRLRQLAQQLRAASNVEDRAAYAEIDSQLHNSIVRSAGNELLAEVYQHLGGALKLSMAPELWDQALAVEELEHHEALVKAIVDKKPEAAEAAASRIVEALREAVLPRASAPRRKPRSQE